MIIDRETVARDLEATGDYRVLRKLALPALAPFDLSTPIFRGLIVDCETTGLDIDDGAKAIELALLPFAFAAIPTGAMFAAFDPVVRMLQDPGEPIPPPMTAIHGIADADVVGQVFDTEALEALALDADIVIAHNAQFDREFFEAATPAFAAHNWACSATQVPWKDHGYSSRGLESILYQLGRFYGAHQASNDCVACAYALSVKVGPSTGLQHAIDATRRRSWRVICRKSPFERKDALKDRGYAWHPKDKTWRRELPWDDEQTEAEWLRAKIYRVSPIPVDFVEVTAKNRFTDRTL